jgi:hypothetical protein
MYRDISSDVLEISRVINTTSVASLVKSIMEKISTDEKGKVTSITLDKGCPSAAREKIDVASQAAQMNEKMLKAKQEALKSAIEKANKDGDAELAKALQGKMDKVVETRRTNSENIDRLESVASDYALKYKPKNDLGDQRAHALFLQKQREKLEQRMKREEDAGFPSGDSVEKIKRRLERVTTAQTESDKWFETNDPNWSKVSKAVGGNEKAVAANEKEKLSATLKGSAEGKPQEKPQDQQTEPKATEAEKAPQEAEWFRVAKEARPGGTWKTAKGKFGAKSSSGEVGNGRKGVRYFPSQAAANSFAASESQASSAPAVAEPKKSKVKKTEVVAAPAPASKKKAVKPKPKKVQVKKTRKESLAQEILNNYLTEGTYKRSGLGRWFEDESATSEPGWDRYNTKGERIGKCGDAEEGEAYAACLSKQKADKLGKEGISSFVRRKRSAQKKAGMAKKGTGEAGGGEEPVRVSTGIDKVDEDWSQDYKDSIDCDNPKGFSQRAHCQGKEKSMNEGKEISIEELKNAVKQLIELIKMHEKLAYDAKKAGNMAEYKKHRGHIAEFSADIKTVQDLVKRALDKRAAPITEEDGEEKTLNKPFRTPGEKKKFAVYVKNDSGNTVMVRFGDPNMEIKRDDPNRLKAFRSRHSCDDSPGPKWKARYWSCQMWRADKGVSEIISEAEKNEPTNPELWEKIQDLVSGRIGSIEHNGKTIEGPNGGKGFDVHPSAYSNAWASKLYGQLGGNWRAVKKESYLSSMKNTVETIVENTIRKKS